MQSHSGVISYTHSPVYRIKLLFIQSIGDLELDEYHNLFQYFAELLFLQWNEDVYKLATKLFYFSHYTLVSIYLYPDLPLLGSTFICIYLYLDLRNFIWIYLYLDQFSFH